MASSSEVMCRKKWIPLSHYRGFTVYYVLYLVHNIQYYSVYYTELFINSFTLLILGNKDFNLYPIGQ